MSLRAILSQLEKESEDEIQMFDIEHQIKVIFVDSSFLIEFF